MIKSHLNEYQNLTELKRFINKYLNLKLDNFNVNTKLIVDYQDGIYLKWCPCYIQGDNIEFNWATFDYLNKSISVCKRDILKVNDLLKQIDKDIEYLETFEVRPITNL